MEKRFIMEWKCGECSTWNISDTERTHQMDICQCGKSGVDLEEHLTRTIGNISENRMSEVLDGGVMKEIYANTYKQEKRGILGRIAYKLSCLFKS